MTKARPTPSGSYLLSTLGSPAARGARNRLSSMQAMQVASSGCCWVQWGAVVTRVLRPTTLQGDTLESPLCAS